MDDHQPDKDSDPETVAASPRARSNLVAWVHEPTLPAVPSTLDEAGLPASADHRYRLGELLGRGGMGEVHLAVDQRVGRDVALKVLIETSDGTAAPRSRFIREARLQSKLEHPGVVPIYDLGVDGLGRHFFVMKRVAGLTLEEVVGRLAAGDPSFKGRFPLPRLLAAFLQVCLTVEYAHSRGVVHRDLKLSNIMLGAFGEVYLLDWGVAKALGDPELARDPLSGRHVPTAETSVDDVLGTLGYMPPEQIEDSASVDARADVYALGAILFALVTQQRLHVGADRAALAKSTLDGVEARPSVRAPHVEVAPELDAICSRATAVHKEDRFPSARALHDAVQEILEGERSLATLTALSEKHLELARLAMRVESDQGAPEADARRNALQHAARALALHPDNNAAGRFMSHLLLAPLTEVPAEVRREMAEEQERGFRRSASTSAATMMLSLAGGLVLLAWVGVREWEALAVLGLAVTSTAMSAWLLAHKKISLVLGVPLAAAFVCLAVAMTSRIAGPLWLAPMLGMTVVATVAAHASLRRWRGVALGAVFVGILGPWLLELTGHIEPHYSFANGAVVLRPDLAELDPERAPIAVAIAACAMILQVFFTISQFKSDDEERAMQHRIATWQHRQLAALGAVPDASVGTAPHASAAASPPPPELVPEQDDDSTQGMSANKSAAFETRGPGDPGSR